MRRILAAARAGDEQRSGRFRAWAAREQNVLRRPRTTSSRRPSQRTRFRRHVPEPWWIATCCLGLRRRVSRQLRPRRCASHRRRPRTSSPRLGPCRPRCLGGRRAPLSLRAAASVALRRAPTVRVCDGQGAFDGRTAASARVVPNVCHGRYSSSLCRVVVTPTTRGGSLR